jgi:hypothetical protein
MKLFHPDTKWRRVALHSPHGIICGLALIYFPPLGAGFLVSFLVYELIEDFHERDEAYHDILGFLISLFIVICCALIWRFIQCIEC